MSHILEIISLFSLYIYIYLILFYSYIVFHCMAVPWLFNQPLLTVIGVFPVFSIYKLGCNISLYTYIHCCFLMGIYLSWYGTRSKCAHFTSWWLFLNSQLKRLHWFTYRHYAWLCLFPHILSNSNIIKL